MTARGIYKTPADVPIEQQLACVEREIRMRERVYTRWVGQGKMSPETCDDEIVKMRAVRNTIANLAAGQQRQNELGL